MISSVVQSGVEIITTADRLQQAAGIMSAQSEIAVDLEMDSLHHYQEKVCLIQISTRSESWLIDPLALETLAPLAEPLANPDILVVMHGADYDIRSLHRDFNITVTSLFDTMIASRFLGIAEIGLAALLKERFGILLDKKYQKADWSKRPLPPEMCAYAAADTATLLSLYDQLSQELQQAGRYDWFDEECRLVCQARVTEKQGPLFLSCKGASVLKGAGLTILEELLQLRDRQARLLDRPPFKVLSAETLVAIAEAAPKTIAQLAEIKGMTPGQLSRFGEAMLAIIEQVMQQPVGTLLTYPRKKRIETTDGSKERLKQLKIWRDAFSRTIQLDPGLLAPNWLLERIADANLHTLNDLETIADMRNWQKKLYGAQVIMTVDTLLMS